MRLTRSLLLLSLVTIACLCSDEEISRQQAPNGQYLVLIMQRDCGAISSSTRHVILAKTSSVSPATTGTSVFALTGSGSVTAHWIDAKQLKVQWQGEGLATGLQLFEDIRITYVPELKSDQIVRRNDFLSGCRGATGRLR